jgi:hypothetical protein
MTEAASLVLVDREVLVEEQELPEQSDLIHSCGRSDWQSAPLGESLLLDDVHITFDPLDFLVQTVWDSLARGVSVGLTLAFGRAKKGHEAKQDQARYRQG